MFATDKIGSTMTVAMTPADGKAWFGTVPPDLSVEARVRGVDWLYNYFLGFYRDEGTVTGWNNLVFPNVAMPHVLWQLSGSNKLVQAEFDNHDKARRGRHRDQGTREDRARARTTSGTCARSAPMPTRPGTMTPVEYQAFVADLVNFMDYMAEPTKNQRISLGIVVLLYLGVLFVLVYALKRVYWKDVH